MSASTDQVACKDCHFLLLPLYLNLQIYFEKKNTSQTYAHINTNKGTLIVQQKLDGTVQLPYKVLKPFFIHSLIILKSFFNVFEENCSNFRPRF